MTAPPPARFELDHAPARPAWDCTACGRPWPCDPAREKLRADLYPVPLAMYAWDRLEEATRDLPNVPVGELFERFLSWTRGPHDR